MGHTGSLRHSTRLGLEGAALLVLMLSSARPAPGQGSDPLQFTRINQPGFGDSQNSYSWSMAWFQGSLYVGTNRDFACVERATEAFYNVGTYTTNPAPCVTCPPDPYDMDLRAEIWRYSPTTGLWARVYQSPADLPNPKEPGKFVARDIGYRNMVVFNEADGTEALYVLGAAAREYIPGLPPPRILRTTDGLSFTPIPQDPGTFMGDLTAVDFRAAAVYGNRLFITASPSLTGDGVVLASSAPALGNDSFQQVTTSNLKVYELDVFNNYLYIGAGDQNAGYSVLKTDATGVPPYALTPVVTNGAGRGSTMASVVSMHVFNGRLYVGAAAWYPTLYIACEMIRIATDDSWQVVVGDPRLTPGGLQFPISGLPDGFGNPYNAHIWRMEDHQGVLYAGTNDDSGGLAGIPVVNLLPALTGQYGFDLFSSADGRYWTQITRNAFGNSFDFGCRCITSTPAGLFLGSTNYAQGTGVWLGAASAAAVGAAAIAPIAPSVRSAAPRVQAGVASPSRLSVEADGTMPVVSWDPAPRASRYRVFRADYRLQTRVALPKSPATSPPAKAPAGPGRSTGLRVAGKGRTPSGVWVRGPFRPISTTDRPFYLDTGAAAGGRYAYYVQAEDREGRSSGPSNAAAAMALVAPVATFAGLDAEIRGLVRRRKIRAPVAALLLEDLTRARKAAEQGDLALARSSMDSLHRRVTRDAGGALAPADAEDVEVAVAQLRRRIDLARAGALSLATLLRPNPKI